MNQIKNRHFLTNSYSNSTISKDRFLGFLEELKTYVNNFKKINDERQGETYFQYFLNSFDFGDFEISELPPLIEVEAS